MYQAKRWQCFAVENTQDKQRAETPFQPYYKIELECQSAPN